MHGTGSPPAPASPLKYHLPVATEGVRDTVLKHSGLESLGSTRTPAPFCRAASGRLLFAASASAITLHAAMCGVWHAAAGVRPGAGMLSANDTHARADVLA